MHDPRRDVRHDDEPERRGKRPQTRLHRRQPKHQLQVLRDEEEVADHDEDREDIGRQRHVERPDLEEAEVHERVGEAALTAHEERSDHKAGHDREDGPAATPILAIIAGLVIGTFFVRRQRCLSDPFMDFRLFQIRTFNVALATNFLAVFVVIGYFLFVAQYLQLVLGLSPVQAGLWSLPSALGFIVMSNVAPRIVHRVSPASVLGTCFVLASMGLVTLTQVGTLDGLAVIVSASVTISLALAPVFTLTTELIVGSAPPERAGAASGISETATELGGALGIAMLGSIGMAVYRAALEGRLPAGLPPEAAQVALGTLGGALGVARQLSDPLGVALLSVARNGFVQGFHLAAALSACIAIVAGVVAVLALHRDPANREVNTNEPSKPEFAVSDASAD